VARWEKRLSENAAGEFFVDSSCIDCGVCREVSPTVFAWSERGRSFVKEQPRSEAERLRAEMALVACPTASIGTEERRDISRAVAAFPEEVAPRILFCGFTSAATYGAKSYLLLREEGNVLVDSPRATEPLLRSLEARGGVALMFLSHRDDVGDHALFRRRFSCERIFHEADGIGASIERPLRGDEPIRLAADLLAIPVPGHTRGSTALLYRDETLFTGDHLWATDDGEHLEAGRGVCWYSWKEQARSMEKLLDFRFEHVLPGHGRAFHGDPERVRSELAQLVRRMVSSS
jgi:glyoxylase-like metal-dependent hydrolase (beta-lactamase superfamily II)/ferredoxin